MPNESYSVIGDKVVVRRDPPKETYGNHGLLLPDSAQQDTQWGTIVSAGDKWTDELLGKKVLFSAYSGIDFIEEGDTEMVESNIYAVIELVDAPKLGDKHNNRIVISPRGDWILVYPEPIKKETASGIATVFMIEEEQRFGQVRAVGPKVDPDISDGVDIMFNRWCGLDFAIDGEKWLLVQQKDVYGIIDEREEVA